MQYVGQTNRKLRVRLCSHQNNPSGYIGRAIRKYGLKNFKVEILEECETPEQLNEREIFWISTLNTKSPNGYNLTDGGEGMHGFKYNEETRAKISTNNPRKRLVRCLESGVIYESLAAASRATKIDIKYISRNCTGERTHALELHFEFVDENLRKKAELKQKQKKNLRKRPIICLDTGEIFESAIEAAKHFNILPSTICSVCRGKVIRSGGMKFEYLDQPLSEENRRRERNNPNAKKIRCIDTGEIFNSILVASKAFNISTSSISFACNSERKSGGGYHWEFVK